KIVNVSGACNENVTISGFDRLTLLAAPGATLSDASGGTVDVLQVLDSSTVHIEGFIMNGGVSCLEGSHCVFVANTFQGSSGDGVQVSRSYADLLPDSAGHGSVIQNSVGRGLIVINGSVVRTIDLTVQHSVQRPFESVNDRPSVCISAARLRASAYRSVQREAALSRRRHGNEPPCRPSHPNS